MSRQWLMRVSMHAFMRVHAFVYHASGGRLLSSFRGSRVLLLTTTGRKSGKLRTVPLLYLQDGTDYIIVASTGGAPAHPAWYHNLRADSRVHVQAGNRQMAAEAETVVGEGRAELWTTITAMYSDYATYQTRTSREIPLVRLCAVHSNQSA